MTERERAPFPNRCAGCGAAVTEWDDEYGYVWDERGFATCGESDTAHHLPAEGRERAPMCLSCIREENVIAGRVWPTPAQTCTGCGMTTEMGYFVVNEPPATAREPR